MTVDAGIELIHRIVGYPLAFIVAPLALASFAGAPGHRWSGKSYALAMVFLYVTGTTLTLTRHPWGTWEFGRDVTFNLLGFMMLIQGWRAMKLRQAVLRNAQLTVHPDRGLMIGQAGLVLVMMALALQRANSPMHVFAVIGVVLVALDVRDWRRGFTARSLYDRHVRYILASYFYVLTVVSIVHLRDELPNDVRWLWPSALGVLAVWLVGEGRRTTRWTMRAVLALSLGFGAYVAWEVARDHGHVERVLGAIQPLLDVRDVMQVQA